MADVALARRTDKGPKSRNERNILTFYEKIAVIRYYDETNISRNSLAKMFHCCATQIRRILERKDELLQQLATLSEAGASIIIEEMTRKRRKFEMSAISFILHQWVERCRQLRLRQSITNQTLKETALKMAAILNLPTFRPSYRWLNRFRGKYKYNEQNLGAADVDSTATVVGDGDAMNICNSGELSVEDIIIEFKDALPSFMQREISAITAISAKDENKDKETENDCESVDAIITSGRDDVVVTKKRFRLSSLRHFGKDNSNDFDISAEDDEDNDDDGNADGGEDDVVEVTAVGSATAEPHLSPSPSDGGDTLENAEDMQDAEVRISAGTSALLGSVFPHLAVIHQFALLNSDVRALELISQLGVHMQTQASEGAYKKLSLATNNNHLERSDSSSTSVAIYAADMDDIVLIE